MRSGVPTERPQRTPGPAAMLGSAWEWLVGVLAATSAGDGPCHVAEALRKEREQRGGSRRDRSQSHWDLSGDATSAAAAEAAEAATWLDSRWAEGGVGGAGGAPLGDAERAMVESILAEEDEEGDDAFLDSLLILPAFADDASLAEDECEDTESTSSSSTSSTFSTSSSDDSTPPRSRHGGDGRRGGGEGGGVQGKRRGNALWGEPSKQQQLEEAAQLPPSAWQTLGMAAAVAFRLSPNASQEASPPLPPPPPLEHDEPFSDSSCSPQHTQPTAAAGPTLAAQPPAEVPTTSASVLPTTQPTLGSMGPCPPKRTRSVRHLLDEVVCQTTKEGEHGGARVGTGAGARAGAAPSAPATSAATPAGAEASPGGARWRPAGCPGERREPTGSSPKSVFEGYWAGEEEEEALLPPPGAAARGKRLLCLDLDETLIHSVFQPCAGADFRLQVQLDQGPLDVYVIKRPGVDEFLRRMAAHYEILVFTASVREYADPLLDILDTHRVVSHRLFRDSCTLARCGYVKDLARLGRPLGGTIIIDNSPHAYAFHPDNALPILSFYDDPSDTELQKICPFLESLGGVPGDARQLLTAALGADVKSLLHSRLSYIL